jgi:hypothetical protein
MNISCKSYPVKPKSKVLYCLYFFSGTENLDELLSTVLQRIGAENEQDRPQLLVRWAYNYTHAICVLY